MQCPNCAAPVMDRATFRSIDVDHCPNCGGVWLDKGELEKLVALGTAHEEERYRRPGSRDDYESSRGSGTARTRSTENEDDEEDDDDDGGREGGRSRDDDDGQGRSREMGRYERREENDDGYLPREADRNRRPEPAPGQSEDHPSQGRSIWREIFEELNKLPLPRV